jgi:hypothetical protein
MERGEKLSKPVVTSSIAAENEAKQWADQQIIKSITDGDGDVWFVQIKTDEGFESPVSEEYLNTVSIVMSKEMGSKDLIASGVLDEKKDYRMVSLIGGASVYLEMNPVQFKDRVLANAKQAARDYLVTLREKLESQSLIEIKRRLVHSWIDQSGRFGRKNDKRLVARL